MSDASADRGLAAGLYLVATPIGNLDDITLRALAVLRGVDLILAEDTRRTRKLLTHYDIAASLQALHEHNEAARVPGVIARLAAGERLALVSDAGTPLVSDPGYALVRAAIDAAIPVIPIPGASSLLAALTASGLPPDRFTFVGFLPRKRGARARLFEELADDVGTLIFMESPRRVARSLAEAARLLGDRPAAVARELTKVHEEVIRGTLPKVAARLADGEVRGEVVVCVAGRGASSDDREDGPEARRARVAAIDRDALQARFDKLLAAGAERNDALRRLAAEHGVARRDVYKLLLIDT